MTQSGILETRSNLSRIVNKVLHGHEHIILRDGEPVARIVPIEDNELKKAMGVTERIKEFRRHAPKITMAEIIAWKNEGRV